MLFFFLMFYFWIHSVISVNFCSLDVCSSPLSLLYIFLCLDHARWFTSLKLCTFIVCNAWFCLNICFLFNNSLCISLLIKNSSSSTCLCISAVVDRTTYRILWFWICLRGIITCCSSRKMACKINYFVASNQLQLKY